MAPAEYREVFFVDTAEDVLTNFEFFLSGEDRDHDLMNRCQVIGQNPASGKASHTVLRPVRPSPRLETRVPLTNSARISEHILCQLVSDFKFLFFISFLKIEYNNWSNFAVQHERMAKNCPRLTILNTPLDGSRLDTRWVSRVKELPGLVKRRVNGGYRIALPRESVFSSSPTPTPPSS